MKNEISLKTGTQPAKDFFISWADINHFFDFIIILATSSDESARVASATLMEIIDDPIQKAEIEHSAKNRKTAISEVKKYRQLLCEIILSRHIDNFNNYFSSVLYEIFISRPETLKSSDKIEISKVLEHESIESLVREIAETKVASLSYSSFSNVAAFFENRFNIKLPNDSDIMLLNEFVEIRNISVHNRCYINKRFLANVDIDDSYLGKKKRLNITILQELVPKLATTIIHYDKEVRRKMKISGLRLNFNSMTLLNR